VPVDGRFEHIVLSCNATSDHAIIWIEKEAQRALDVSVIVYWDKLSFILCLSFFVISIITVVVNAISCSVIVPVYPIPLKLEMC